MDFLKAEVEKRKRELETVKNKVADTGIVTAPDGRKVYVKRNDTGSQGTTTLSSSSSSTVQVIGSVSSLPVPPSVVPSSSSNSHHTTNPSSVPSSTTLSSSPLSSSSSSTGKNRSLSSLKAEIIHRCRKYGLVTTYFGETDEQRFYRLREYEIQHYPDSVIPLPSQDDDEEKNNVSLSSTTTTSTIAQLATTPIANSTSASSSSSSSPLFAHPVDDEPEQKRKRFHRDESTHLPSSSSIPITAPTVVPEKNEKERKHTDALKYGKHKDPYKYLYAFWRGLLYEWEQIINQQRSALETTAIGKQEINLFQQAEEYMRPFFKACKHENLPSDIYTLVLEITDALLVKDYIKAGDSYMKLAIGNQQWVMGVSQVGLHERSAREKVYVGKITHVLNDEAQRRYITTMKRLMTFLEKQYPTDPSKMV